MDDSTTITCPKCHKDMDVKNAVKGSGPTAIFTCIYCGETGENPLD